MNDSRVALDAFAKINLFLRVDGKRDDGFHEIESVFQAIDLSDRFEFVRAPDGIDLHVEVIDALASPTPADESNLVHKAAVLVRERAREVAPNGTYGAHISLRKRIPSGAGLGGGSSDAAATLRALDAMWDTELDARSLLDLAAALGSDVPYFVCDYGTALARGRGEIVIPLGFKELWFVLCCSHEPLATGAVYDAWDSFEPRGEMSIQDFLEVLQEGSLDDIAGALRNDLEAAAISLRPDLELRLADVVGAGALAARVSGSGPTIYGLAESRAHAEEIAAGVEGAFARTYVVGAVPRCSAPTDEA